MINLKLFAALTLLGGVLQKLTPFITSLLVANIAGELYFAQFTFAINTANTIVAVCAMGMSPAILTALSEGCKEDHRKGRGAVGGLLRVAAMVATITFLIGVGAQSIQPESIAGNAAYVSIIILGPALVLNQATYTVYQGLSYYDRSALQSFGLFGLVVISVLFCITMGLEKSVHYFYSWAYFAVGVSAYILLALGAGGREKGTPIVDSSKAVSLFKMQLPFAGYTAVWMLAMYACNFEIAKSYSSGELAVYNVSFQWYSILLMAPSLLGGVLIPYFSSESSGEKNGIQLVRITAVYGLIGLPITIALMCSVPAILGLYSITANEISVDIFKIMLASGALAIIMMPALQLYLAKRQFIPLYMVSGVWTITALSGVYIFADSALGVAKSFFAAYILVTMVVAQDLYKRRHIWTKINE